MVSSLLPEAKKGPLNKSALGPDRKNTLFQKWVHSARDRRKRRTAAPSPPSTAVWPQMRPCPAARSQGDVCVKVPRCVLQPPNLSSRLGDAQKLPEIILIKMNGRERRGDAK